MHTLSEKNEIIVKIDELRTSKLNLKFLILKKNLKKQEIYLFKLLKLKQIKPKSELINIFYSNNQYLIRSDLIDAGI